MAGKVQLKREALHARLVNIAEDLITQKGIGAIKARELAAAAECSVGAIYNVFEDLNDLVMVVNFRTFKRIGEHIAAATEGKENPHENMLAMGTAYLEFAEANPRTWRTLFDIEKTIESNVPDWYMAELERLFGFIAKPLRRLWPDKSRDQIDLDVRTLFSAVHGIVLLGTERRISAVPTDHLKLMIEHLINTFTQKN